MLLEIKPLDGYEWDCFAGSIIPILSYWNRIYFLAFSDAWAFRNYQLNLSVDENYNLLARSYINIDNIIRQSNLHVNKYEKLSVLDALSIIFYELNKGRPVIVHCNLFWVPWFLNTYQKAHPAHFF
jgi:hypothetical protein